MNWTNVFLHSQSARRRKSHFHKQPRHVGVQVVFAPLITISIAHLKERPTRGFTGRLRTFALSSLSLLEVWLDPLLQAFHASSQAMLPEFCTLREAQECAARSVALSLHGIYVRWGCGWL